MQHEMSIVVALYFICAYYWHSDYSPGPGYYSGCIYLGRIQCRVWIRTISYPLKRWFDDQMQANIHDTVTMDRLGFLPAY